MQYGARRRTSQFKDLFLSERPTMWDLTVHYRLDDHPEQEHLYILTAEEQFEANIQTYIAAITSGAGHADRLMSGCPEVMDFWTLSDSVSEAAIERYLANTTVRVTYHDEHGVRHNEHCQLAKVAEERSEQMMAHLPAEVRKSTQLFEAVLPDVIGPVEVQTRSKILLPKATRTTFWTADRPTFVRSITMDFSGIASQDVAFSYLPFLSSDVGPVKIDLDERYLSVPVNNWLVAGQGIVLRWGSRIAEPGVPAGGEQ